MNYRDVKVQLAGFLVVGVFSLCLAGTTMAQGKPTGAGPPPNNNPNLDDRIRQVDESRLRSAEMGVGTEEKNQKLLQAAIANMKEDVSPIQTLLNDIARHLVARKPLDYKPCSEQPTRI